MLKYAKVANEYTKECSIYEGDNPKYIALYGVELQEVEQSYNEGWYLLGYAPTKPIPTFEEVEVKRACLYKEQVDPLTAQIIRKRDVGIDVTSLVLQRNALVASIKQTNPYPEDESAGA